MGYFHGELPMMSADLQPWFVTEVVRAALTI